MQVADRYRRMGVRYLCCALMMATGLSRACGCTGRDCADLKALLVALCASALCHGLQGVAANPAQEVHAGPTTPCNLDRVAASGVLRGALMPVSVVHLR